MKVPRSTLIVAVVCLALACAMDAANGPHDTTSRVRQIALQDTAITLLVGEGRRISVTAFDSAGAVLSGVRLVWSSRDSSVVIIDSTGMATGLQAGSAALRVSTGPVNATTHATVKSRITGTYSLVSVNGGAAPLAAGVTATGCPQTLDNATLVMSANPRNYDLAFQLHVICPYPLPGTTSGATHLTGTWTESADNISFVGVGGGSNIRLSATTAWANGIINLNTPITFAVQTPMLSLVFKKQ